MDFHFNNSLLQVWVPEALKGDQLFHSKLRASKSIYRQILCQIQEYCLDLNYVLLRQIATL